MPLFLDPSPPLLAALARVGRDGDPALAINQDPTDPIPPSALPTLIGAHHTLLVDRTPIPTELLRVPTLRHIVFLGTGAGSYIDLAAAASLGVTVHVIRNYGDIAVAEHTIALLFAAARNIAGADRDARAGGWSRDTGVQLAGKTLGLIGVGGIGAVVARLAQGIGMTVLAWNRTERPVPGVAFADLDTVLTGSDAISLHLLLTPETRGILNAGRLARLRPGALLVNTARGALVDEAAMLDALAAGRIGHAALDVFAMEPLPPDHQLRALPNVTLSPHRAFRTQEATEALMRRALDIVAGLG